MLVLISKMAAVIPFLICSSFSRFPFLSISANVLNASYARFWSSISWSRGGLWKLLLWWSSSVFEMCYSIKNLPLISSTVLVPGLLHNFFAFNKFLIKEYLFYAVYCLTIYFWKFTGFLLELGSLLGTVYPKIAVGP